MDHTSQISDQGVSSPAAANKPQQPTHTRLRPSADLAWEMLLPVDLDRKRLAASGVVTLDRLGSGHAELDMLRTKTLQCLRANGWISVAITSPTRSCGKTLTALNLAFSLAHQRDCRTLVIDFNFRAPRFRQILGVAAPVSMADFLSRDAPMSRALLRYGGNLAIGTSEPTEFSAELLQSKGTAPILEDMQRTLAPDVIVYDMPSMAGCDDVTAFLPRVDAALLVAEADRTTFEEIDTCTRHLAERTNLLGVVLNKCRYGTA